MEAAKQLEEQPLEPELTPEERGPFNWKESADVVRWLREGGDRLSVSEVLKRCKFKKGQADPFFDINNEGRLGYVDFTKIEAIELSPELSKPRGRELGVYSYRQPYLAQQPCECTDTVTCCRCVHARLFKQREKDPFLIDIIRKRGVRKTARLVGLSTSTVSSWIQRENVPSRYREKVKKVFGA